MYDALISRPPHKLPDFHARMMATDRRSGKMAVLLYDRKLSELRVDRHYHIPPTDVIILNAGLLRFHNFSAGSLGNFELKFSVEVLPDQDDVSPRDKRWRVLWNNDEGIHMKFRENWSKDAAQIGRFIRSALD